MAGAQRVTELSRFNHTADIRDQDDPPPVELDGKLPARLPSTINRPTVIVSG
jgi:hypothetical protein